jgi:hypothetical protein
MDANDTVGGAAQQAVVTLPSISTLEDLKDHFYNLILIDPLSPKCTIGMFPTYCKSWMSDKT